MVQQSNTATLTDNIGHQRLDTARTDPTAPLSLGTTPDTDEPVTLARTEPFDPILITGDTGTGKTTLTHHIAYQLLHPNSGLCYVSKIDPSTTDLLQSAPPSHECATIAPDRHADPTAAIPDDMGTDQTIHSVRLGPDTNRNTTLVQALLGQVRQNRYKETPTDHHYTLVIDGQAGITWDHLALDTVLAEARQLHLHIIITTQGLLSLPPSVQQHLRSAIRTYITGHVRATEAQTLAAHAPTPTADELGALDLYQWVLHQQATDPEQTTQFTSPPPQLLRPDDY